MKRLHLILLLLCAVIGTQAAAITGNLPVVYINTQDNTPIESKEVYVAGTFRIDALSTGYAGLESVTGQFKGRGNWTWNGFDKKPYRIKLDKKQKVLGMPSNKHWCLMAHADDNLGFLRNKAGYMLSEHLGMKWTPRMVPVELVLNGQYQGLYFLTEHVRAGADRVNITEQEDLATDSVSGGWLVEIDNYREEGNIEFYEGNGQFVMITPKVPEILSDPQRTYLKQQIFTLNDKLYGSSSEQLFNMLDLQEAAKYYLVQEIMEDCESYHGSCYLYKERDRNGETAKWFFGPVWDFGNAYMRHQETWIYIDPSWPQYWIGQLATWPEFQKAVKEQWWIFYHNDKDAVRADLRTFANLIEAAAAQDAEVWRGTNNYCDNSNYSEVRDRFFRRYDWRIQWLYSQWGEGIKPADPNPEGIEQNIIEKPSHGSKILHDGQLLIRRGDKVYTVTGQEVTGL